jgi:hypothetical protein
MQDAAVASPSPSPDDHPARRRHRRLGIGPDSHMTENPYITFRDGPTGPRAALIDGPDIWEVIQTIDSHPGDPEAAIPATAELLDLTEQQVQAATYYRAINREEIDARIELNAQTPELG